MSSFNFISALRYNLRNSFGVLGFAVFLFLFFLVNYFANSYLIKNDPLILSEDIKTVLMGDSQVIHGCDPAIIDSSVNLGQDAAPLITTYYYLRFLIEHNPGIKNVVLNVNFNSFLDRNEIKFRLNSFAQEFMTVSYPFMTMKDYGKMDISETTFFEVFLRNKCIPNYLYWRNCFHRLSGAKDMKYPYNKGGFVANNNVADDINDVNYLRKRAKERIYGNYDRVVFGNINSAYIDSCAAICEVNNINLFVVRFPITSLFREFIPSVVNDYIDDKVTKLKQNYSSVTYLDFQKLFDEEYFSDYLHLKSNGAEKLSKLINSRINK